MYEFKLQFFEGVMVDGVYLKLLILFLENVLFFQ